MTLRAAIYARYSSDLQREASILDQSEVCGNYIKARGWTLVETTYADPAASGADNFRPGFLRLQADAKARRFDVIVCEAVDRLSRNLAQAAKLFDELTFFGVEIHTPGSGLLTQMYVGIMGTMAQMQLADIRDKTKRGLGGRVRDGASAGGLAYGYDIVPPQAGTTDRGGRQINEVEAAVIRRIFVDYSAGMSPRQIAAKLNSSNVPGPGGRPWGDTTLRGQAERHTGILNNTLYIAKLTWNVCSYVKNPTTGRRVARVNPVNQHQIVAVPKLRIIDDELWQLVKDRQAIVRIEMEKDATGNPLNRAHRRKFLLSGLIECGKCGAGYAILGKDRYGCANRRSKATCDNSATIDRRIVERRVLAALQGSLLTAELVATFVTAFDEELMRLRQESAGTQKRLRDQSDAVDRKIESLLNAIESGAWNASVQKRLTELEVQQVSLRKQFQEIVDPAPVVRLHPNAAAIYSAKVADLQEALDQPDIRSEAMQAVQSLIERIILTPDERAPNGLAIDLHGDLATILTLASTEAPRRSSGTPDSKNPRSRSVPGALLSVVAGARFERAAFRL